LTPERDERANLVLGAPLGRAFLAEFIGFHLEQRLFESLGLGLVSGTAIAEYRPIGAPRKPKKPKRPHREWTDVKPDEAQRVIAAMVAQDDWGGLSWRQLSQFSELDMLIELAQVSNQFGFGGGDEALWGLTGLATDTLLPVAQALVDSPATARWWDPVETVDQRLLEWDDLPVAVGPQVEATVRETMAAEREENEEGRRRKRPRVRGITGIGATWWSAPGFAPETWTTGAFGDVPTIALGNFIDTYSPFSETGATVWSVDISPDARVSEITTPGDWRELVKRYPRDVTGTHDGEWRDWGGVEGPWRLPDWEQVMDRFDGVHVTIGGYVATCGLALPVGDGFTMLAGWVPDATLWLRDVTTSRRSLGRWLGRPHSVSAWDDVRDRWEPA
jgi:hypothetical protein